MGVSLARLFWIARELCVVTLLYAALMTLPALFLIDAVWNGGRVASLVFP